MRSWVLVVGSLSLLVGANRGLAAEVDEERWVDDRVPASPGPGVSPSLSKTVDASYVGNFLPFGQPAHMNALGYVASTGGYDSARSKGLFDTNLEARILGPIALRLGSSYAPDTQKMRPSVGLRVGLLDAAKHGVDLSAGVLYRPEGFTETEGEIEGTVALGVRLHEFMLLGNLVYGQDPEGHERDGELCVAVLHRLGTRVVVGLDSRARLNLASSGGGPNGEARFDAVAGPAASIAIGPLGILLNGGGTVVQVAASTPVRYGAYVMGGLGLGL